MSQKPKVKKSATLAQTATELAIFGTLLIFVLGLVIRYAINFNFQQQMPMQAFRSAFQLSAGSSGARRNASVIMFEDRDTPDVSTPLAISQRVTFAAQGSAMVTNALYSNMDFCDQRDLPRMDMFFNGKWYNFTTADFKQVSTDDGTLVFQPIGTPCPTPHVRAGTFFGQNENVLCAKMIDDDPAWTQYPCPTDWKTGALIANCFWKWKEVPADTSYISMETKDNSILDVDGDGKEELILGIVKGGKKRAMHEEECEKFCLSALFLGFIGNSSCENDCIDNGGIYAIKTFKVIDYQEGDIDLTINSKDINDGRVTQGLKLAGPSEFVENRYKVEEPTSFRRSEDQARIETTSRVKRADFYDRRIQLNCGSGSNTGRACNMPNSCLMDSIDSRILGQVLVNNAMYPIDEQDFWNGAEGELKIMSKRSYEKKKVWRTDY